MSRPLRIGVTVVNMDCGDAASEAMEYLVNNTSEDAFVFLTDNGSIEPPEDHPDYPTLRLPVNDGVTGVWYKMKDYLAENKVDVLVCCHADFFILDKDWDRVVSDAFTRDEKLILASFVGSRGVGSNGGRSHGLYLGFVGNQYRTGNGSPFSVHGSKTEGIIPAACFDHCVMIYKVAEFDLLRTFFPDPPPIHFEDRILPAAANYYGYHCAVLDVNCDHTSGAKGTQVGMENYYTLAKRWLDERGIEHPADGNYDRTLYLIAEHRFLDEWRDEKHFVPFNVLPDYRVETKGRRP
ncbi:MAG: hypothetical protein KOO63_04025 [Bacteroidales bacterium]|nr:hypothetical protein [Candidatus Latescibacterota bacterium]